MQPREAFSLCCFGCPAIFKFLNNIPSFSFFPSSYFLKAAKGSYWGVLCVDFGSDEVGGSPSCPVPYRDSWQRWPLGVLVHFWTLCRPRRWPEKGSRSHLVAAAPSRSHPASLRRWDLKERRERGELHSNINQTHQSPGIWRKWHRI